MTNQPDQATMDALRSALVSEVDSAITRTERSASVQMRNNRHRARQARSSRHF